VLCDRILQERGTPDPLDSFLFEGLRIEKEAMRSLSFPTLRDIERVYQRRPVHDIVEWIADFQRTPTPTS